MQVLMFLLTCFSYNCNLFIHFLLLLFVFMNSFVYSGYTDGMFQSKFPFKDSKVLPYLIRPLK